MRRLKLRLPFAGVEAAEPLVEFDQLKDALRIPMTSLAG